MAKVVKIAEIKNCMKCPYVEKGYVGQGHYSFYCTRTRREENCIAYNCEYPSEYPQNHQFPKWCPLKDK